MSTPETAEPAKPPDIPTSIPPADRGYAVEYIKAMLEYARDDARQVYLRVTAALALAALLVTQLPFKELKGLETAPKVAFFTALGMLVLAALLHHSYLQKVHHARRQIAQCLPSADAAKAEKLGSPTWDRYLNRFKAGDIMLVLAAVLLSWVVVDLFS